MKKCAQCGNDYPVSNESCPKCGYGSNGFANNQNANNGNNKVVKIIIIVVAVMVAISTISIVVFSKFMFNNIVDFGENLENGFATSTVEECSDRCDGSYMYVNGTCSCVDMNFE